MPNTGQLPNIVKPIKYDITLKPDLKTFIFSGNVSINIEINNTTDTIILNSSDLSEILGMCDRILILSEYKQKQILKNSNLSSKILLTNFYEDKVA